MGRHVPQEPGSRTPQSGEALILTDGRRFVLATAGDGMRGWWFTATALDGRSTLQGNMRFGWDPQAHAWRPNGVQSVTSQPVPIRRAPQSRHKQVD
jgi:hypothetical protein